MQRVMVRYRVVPDRAAENEALVRAVYEELRASAPADFTYAAFREQDGVSFVHVATGEDVGDTLRGLAAFRRFREGLDERCVEGPVVAQLDAIESFNLQAT